MAFRSRRTLTAISCGLQTEARPADEVIQIAPYYTVIVGSGVYFSAWLPEVVELLESFQDDLAEHPIWLFSDGATDELDLQRGRACTRTAQSAAGGD